MSREPKRWLDDENAPAGVHELLRGSPRARPIEDGARVRVGRRVARLTIVPVSLLTWLGAKAALAALGAAAGVATVGVATVGVRAFRDEPEVQRPVPPEASAVRVPKRVVVPPPVESAAEPEVVAPPEPEPPGARSAAPVPSVAGPPSSAGLAEETAFLERARRTLATDPAFALLLVREHRVRFPRGKLGAEQSLIEIEALYRSGRHAEARALAERKLAAGGSDLYAERVRTLLDRMDPNR